MKNVRIIDKPERGRFEDRDVWSKSSKVTVYNVYEQSWESLQAAGLSHLFESKAEFERKNPPKQT